MTNVMRKRASAKSQMALIAGYCSALGRTSIREVSHIHSHNPTSRRFEDGSNGQENL